MMTTPDIVQQCGMKIETDTSGSLPEIDNQDVNVNVIIVNLFDLGLEEVLQKVFLYLDPKSLKNCKSTCSQWREFIHRRIWNSKSAKHQLHHKLNSGWKCEAPVRMINKVLHDYVHYLVCDSEVIVCGLEGGSIMAFHADTVEQIYYLPVQQDGPFASGDVQMDVFGDHLMTVSDGIVKIFEKMTGKELHSSKPLGTRNVFGVKMLKNVGVVGAENGNICFLRRGATNQEWTEEKVFSGVHEITHIEGEGSRLVIGSRNGIFLWDIEERKVIPSREPVLMATWMLTFHFPHVCVVGGSDWDGLLVLNIVTGKRVRHVETDLSLHNIHSNGRFVLVSEISNIYSTAEHRKEKIEVVMYDMEELRNESIKDTDLWSRRMSFSPSLSQINAVSNVSKFAVSYRKKLTVYDVWKDRDYEECPDESEYKPLDLPALVVSDSEEDEENQHDYYNPAFVHMESSDTDSDEDEEENHPHDDMSSPSSIESESDAENMNE